jgi:hypothetical protein
MEEGWRGMFLDDVDLNLMTSALILLLFAPMLEPLIIAFLSLLIVEAYVAHHSQSGHGTPRKPR